MLINKLTLHIYVLLLVTFFPVNGWGEIYKWVDKHGQTHFSDKRNAADNNAVKERGALSEQDSKARSDLLNSEIGVVLLKQVNHGKYYQYMPEGALSNFRIVVVNHGMFSESETAEASAAATLKAWKRFANKHKITLIAPAYDNHNYAVTSEGDGKGGYRGLFGREVGADIFLHEIINEYKLALSGFDGRFYLSGHSAGAQFANRYLVRHPDRVIAAAFSAPAWFAQPSDNFEWPYGMGRRQFNSRWPGEDISRKVDIQPNKSGWLAAAQKPVAVVVGEQDLERIRHVPGIGGDTHVERAKYWVESMNSYAALFGKQGHVEFKLIPNTGHNYGKLARECQKYLEKYM